MLVARRLNYHGQDIIDDSRRAIHNLERHLCLFSCIKYSVAVAIHECSITHYHVLVIVDVISRHHLLQLVERHLVGLV